MAGRFSPGVLPTPNKHWGESLADALGQGIQSYEHFKGRREAAEEQERERSRQEDADFMSGIRPEGFDFEDETPDGTGGLLSQALPQAPPQPAEAPPVQGPAVGEELAGVIDPQAQQAPLEPRSTSGVPGGFDGRAGRFERRRLKPVQLPSGRMYDPNVVADQKYGERLAAAMAEREAAAMGPQEPNWTEYEGEDGLYRVDLNSNRAERVPGILPKPVQRDPVMGSPEWMAAKRFEASLRPRGGGGGDGPLVRVQDDDGNVVYVPRSEASGMRAPSSVAGGADRVKQIRAIANTEAALNDLEATLNDVGSAVMPGENRALLESAFENYQLQLKELYALGVLAGPDLMLMRRITNDPTSIRGRVESGGSGKEQAKRTLAQIQVMKRRLAGFRNNVEQGVNAGSSTTVPTRPPTAGSRPSFEDWKLSRGGQ